MSQTGERNLTTLLSKMSACIHPDTFVFMMTAERPAWGDGVVMQFQEQEGFTTILSRAAAASLGAETTFPCRMISLMVHSDLAAVGFIARVSAALTAAGISTNPVSGFYHDHLFVPEDLADAAMSVLDRLQSDAAEA